MRATFSGYSPAPVRLLRALAVAATTLALAAGAAAAGQLEMLMFEREGCSYCKRWNEEIGPAYPRTAEGKAAPLRRLDIKAPLPEGITLTGRPPAFTPTFVLTDDGREVARIEGYAGDEFFWVLLDRMLAQAGWSPDSAPAAASVPTPSDPNTNVNRGTE